MTDIDVQATKHAHMYQVLYQLLVITIYQVYFNA